MTGLPQDRAVAVLNRAGATRPEREPARMTPTGLQLRTGISFDAWIGVGRRISELSSASAWWLGDWIVYGERAYGERYKLALRATALDYQTLRNYAWVARRFEPSRRRDRLSFQHHAELAALPEPEQELWLRRAERVGWSRNQLRRNLAAARRGHRDGHDDSVSCRMELTARREQRWREAAAAVDQSLVDWIIAAADAAADALLELPAGAHRSASRAAPPNMPCSVEASSLQPGPVVR